MAKLLKGLKVKSGEPVSDINKVNMDNIKNTEYMFSRFDCFLNLLLVFVIPVIVNSRYLGSDY